MVARGDLGVELGLYRVPFAQKLLIARAKQAGLFEPWHGASKVGRVVFLLLRQFGNVGMNPGFGPLKGNRKGWFRRVIPSLPAEH